MTLPAAPGETEPTTVWRLTTAEKKRILLANIYGVDIDRQAVEVTKLSLLLKMLEGESEQTLGKQMKLMHDRVLPDLCNNIKCGNSLISSDFYDDPANAHLDLAERQRINAFDWNDEFPEIMKRGGFDAVIGNPPYIQSRSGQLDESEKKYFFDKYSVAEYQINTYGLFLEKSLKILRNQCLCGVIIPNYWLSTGFDSQLRKLLFYSYSLKEIINTYNVFKNATVDTVILIINSSNNVVDNIVEIKSISRNHKSIEDRLDAINKQNWTFLNKKIIGDSTDDLKISFSKEFELRGTICLGDLCVFSFGMKPYQVGKGKPPQTQQVVNAKAFDSKNRHDSSWKKLLRARNVKRYSLQWENDWIKYGNHLAEPRNVNLFSGDRLLVQRIVSGKTLEIVYTHEEYICNTDVITVKLKEDSKNKIDILFLLGVLGTKLCADFLKSKNVNLDRQAFPKINTKTLAFFLYLIIFLQMIRFKVYVKKYHIYQKLILILWII